MYRLGQMLERNRSLSSFFEEVWYMMCNIFSQASRRNDLLSNTEFAVPVFHAYGHVLECQVNMYVHYVQHTVICISAAFRMTLVHKTSLVLD